MTFALCPFTLQLLVVVTPDWSSVEGLLYRYERSSATSAWESCGEPTPINVGKNGMAWGRGIHSDEELCGARKKEGDAKSPAGIFSLGPTFGDVAHEKDARNIPFLQIVEDLEWIDDPASTYYNRFVYANSIENKDWKSSENLLEEGSLYSLGLFIAHNVDPTEPGLGSCIFMHIWSEKGLGTAGCTAMEERDLRQVVSWLDELKYPHLVQLPWKEYQKRKESWNLPRLDLF